ncbi:MAG: hypothetical protein IH852_10285 [Bacteroidetes bacterium]|nr:hypothetical protein [Bacteroidota bacterium]
MQTIFLHKIKWYKPFLVFCVLVIQTLLINQIFAQQVQVNLDPAAYNQLYMQNLWSLNINNTTQETLLVYLYATLEEREDGPIANGTSTAFELTPGVRKLTGADYGWLVPQIDYINPDPRYKDGILRTGVFPDGYYTYCVYVRLVTNNEEIASDCKEQSIELVSALELISPLEGATSVNKTTVFTWMLAGTPGTGVNYKIEIVQINDREDPYIAMRNNLIVFEQGNINTTVFQIPVSAIEFSKGKYAWQVIAYNPSGDQIGESEVWLFSVGVEYTPTIDSVKVTCSDSVGICYDFIVWVSNNMAPDPPNGIGSVGEVYLLGVDPPGTVTNVFPLLPVDLLYGDQMTITGTVCYTDAILPPLKFRVSMRDQGNPDDHDSKTTEYVNELPACTCCGGFTREVDLFSYDSTGFLTTNITAGPNPIIKVTAELVYFSVTPGNPDCKTCVKESEQWGNFCVANNLPGFDAPVFTTLPELGQCSREVTWLSTSADGSDLSGGAELNMQLGLRPASTLWCCPDTIELCIRFSFTDSLCVTCDTLVCITIERTSDNVTIVSNTLRDLYENNLGIRNVLLAMGTTDTDNSWFGELTGSALDEFGLNLGKTTDYPTYSVIVPTGNSTDLSGGARLRSTSLLAYNGGWSGQFDSDSPDGILPETDAGDVGFLIPPPSSHVTVTITSDNAYVYGFGDINGINDYKYPGVCNLSPGEILNANSGTETYTIPANFTGGYIYIAAWSDESAWQGVIAEFTDGNTTVLTSPTLPDPDVNWEVYATGENLYPTTSDQEPSSSNGWEPRGNSNAPLLDGPLPVNAINNQIDIANSNGGNPSTTSRGWVNTTHDPDNRVGVLVFGPDNFPGIPGTPFPVVDGITPAAQWMWYNPKPDPPDNITIPFETGMYHPRFPADESREYYIFRVGPIDSLLGDTCDCIESRWGENTIRNITQLNSPILLMNPDTQDTLDCNQTYTINSTYNCQPQDCNEPVTYNLVDPLGDLTVDNVPFSFIPVQSGIYTLTLFGWCGELCDSIVIEFFVECISPGGECCDEFDINVTQDEISDLGDGIYQIIPELIVGPNNITKFSATLEYVNISYNNPECEVCAENSEQYGNLSVDTEQVFTEGGTTLTPVLTGPTNLNINWSREVIWQDLEDDGSVDLTGGFSPEILLKFPPPSPISCCEQTIEFCIRYEFTDENCVTCDTLICYEISPCDILCENNIIDNWSFIDGNVVSGDGSMDYNGQVGRWHAAYRTPQLRLKGGCCDNGWISMWGNKATGEAIRQKLAIPIVKGNTYEVTLCVRRNRQRLDYVQFEVRASMGPLGNESCPGGCAVIGVTGKITDADNWTTVTLPPWTADADYNFITISVTNEFELDDSLSGGHIDKVCIVEVVEVADTCECGEWTDSLQVVYTLDGTTDTTALTCGETVSDITVGTTINITGEYNCVTEDCPPTYEWLITDPNGNTDAGSVLSIDFIPLIPGEYKVQITVFCGSTLCDNCVIIFEIAEVTDCLPPPLDMVAWWSLDESGTTANDIAGFNNVGKHVDNPMPVPGKVAGGLSFGGTTDYVEVADHPELDFGVGDFSIDAWI